MLRNQPQKIQIKEKKFIGFHFENLIVDCIFQTRDVT